MTTDRLESVILSRIAMLSASNPELDIEWAIINDDWGVLTISEGRKVIGFEYVESEVSSFRPERIRVYEETLDHGLSAVVIVPEEMYLEVRRRVSRALGPRSPAVLCYDSIGITAMPRPS
ncbi:MAG: hypothetical protein SA339_08055 [Methanomassiliicoccus sp.]|nr:hypothetical protein [Methanomassiliicoccus sp.]